LIRLKAYITGNTTYGPEDKLALCPPYVFGHSLSMRCWCKFYINQLTAVDWRKNSFRDLLLPDEQKKVIRSLVSSHLFPTETIDEAKLKGKVLVVVLHGTPGTGKTLTAGTGRSPQWSLSRSCLSF
jgi:hypothetical protein